MPASNQRKQPRPGARRRNKRKEVQAKETQAAQRAAEGKRLSLESYRRRRIFGWSLVVLGVIVGVQHLIAHMGFWTLIAPGWDDLVAGYPVAGALGVGGAIILSK